MTEILTVIILACQITGTSSRSINTSQDYNDVVKIQVDCQKKLIVCMDIKYKKGQLNAPIAFKECLLER